MILGLQNVGGRKCIWVKACHEEKNKKNAFKYFQINKKKKVLGYKDSSVF